MNRDDYIASLRQLADLLEATPDLPLPITDEFVWPTHYDAPTDDDVRANMAKIARLLPGRLDKNDPTKGDYAAAYLELTGQVGVLTVKVWAERQRVCRRVETGTREVKTMIPAPDAPLVEHVETVTDYEWVCEPLLAERIEAGA